MIEKPSRGWELSIVATMAAGIVLALAGGIIMNLARGMVYAAGVGIAALGVVSSIASVGLSSQVDRLRKVGASWSGGDRYDQLRNWTRLKVSSILLTVLVIFAAILLVAALLFRLGVFDGAIHYRSVVFSVSLLVFTLVATLQAAQFFSLRTVVERSSDGLNNGVVVLSLIGGLVLSLLSFAMAARPLPIPNVGTLRPVDAPFFLLAASGLASAGLFVARSLPTLYALFYEERQYYKGKTYFSKSKSVLAPTMIAFSMLFVVVLIIFVFEIGVAGLVGEIHQHSLLLGALGFLVAALVATVAVSVLLSRSEDKADLYKVKRSAEELRSITILAVSLGLGGVLIGIAFLLWADVAFLGLRPAWWLDFLTFGLLVSLGPYGFYVASQANRTRRLEERFPDFLRDIAASHKAGLPLSAAVRIAAKGEYGALTPEINKMADQLSWNITFNEVLQQFANRVNTPLIRRSVLLMMEASKSGGSIVDVLMAASRDAREIKNLETERRNSMGLYTAVIYLTFFVFLAVAVLMYRTFITDILVAAGASRNSGATSIGGLSFSDLTLNDYRVFYFVAALMQGLGNGIMAGLMGTGRVLLGLRHSFVMVGLTYFVFKFVG